MVYFHVLTGLKGAGLVEDGSALEWVSTVTGGASMATFFFISGMFVTAWVRRPLTEFAVDRLRFLVYPYVLWVCIMTGVHLLVPSEVTNLDSSLATLVWAFWSPPWHYWYIYTFFFISVAYVLLRKAGLGPLLLLALGVGYFFTIDRVELPAVPALFLVRWYFLYFAFGAVVGKATVIRSYSEARPWVVAGVIASALVLFESMNLTGARDLWYFRPARALTGGTAIFGVAILLQRAKRLRIIEWVGRFSYEIYLGHVLFASGMRIVLDHALDVHWAPLHMALGFLAGVFGPIAVMLASARLGVPYFFTFGARYAARRQPKPAAAPAVPEAALPAAVASSAPSSGPGA